MNDCLTSAKVFRLSEKPSQLSQDRDYTKCTAYKACDQPTLWPALETTLPTSTKDPNWHPCPRFQCPPTTPPSTTPMTTPSTALTTPMTPLDPDLPTWSPLTSESEFDSNFECSDDHESNLVQPDRQKCTLGIVVLDFD